MAAAASTSTLTPFESSSGDSVLLLFDKVPFLFVAVPLAPGGRKILRNFRIILQGLPATKNDQIDWRRIVPMGGSSIKNKHEARKEKKKKTTKNKKKNESEREKNANRSLCLCLSLPSLLPVHARRWIDKWMVGEIVVYTLTCNAWSIFVSSFSTKSRTKNRCGCWKSSSCHH